MLVALPETQLLPANVAAALTARRADCVAELAASGDCLRAAARTAIFVDAPAQDAVTRMRAELCGPYLTLAVAEQLVASGLHRDAAECTAPILLAGLGTTDADVAAVNAMAECGLL